MNIDYDAIAYPSLERTEAQLKSKLNFYEHDFLWAFRIYRECWDDFLRFLLGMDGLTTQKIRRHSFQMGERKVEAISMLAEHSKSGRLFAVTYVALKPGDEYHLNELPAVREWNSVQGEEVEFERDASTELDRIETEPLIVCVMREDIFQTRKFKSISGVPFVENDIGRWDGWTPDANMVPCPTMFLCARYNDGSKQAEFVSHFSDPYSMEFFRNYSSLGLRVCVLIESGIEHIRKKRIDEDIKLYSRSVQGLTDRGTTLEDAMKILEVPDPLREFVIQKLTQKAEEKQ